MAYHVELEFSAKTDTGLVRSHNEDFIAVTPVYGLVILADGMGGYSAGEVASSIAATVVKESLEDHLQNQPRDWLSNRTKNIQQLIQQSISRANVSIIEAAREEPQFSGMGTTLVVGLFHHDVVTLAHVGDSRAYRVRHGELVQLTRDHSLLQEQIDAGLISHEAALVSPNRNLITRAVGVDYEIEIEIHDHVTKVGDIYILCSDGLSDMLSAEEICSTVVSLGTSLEDACKGLIERANKNGGRDNISVILVKIQSIHTQTEKLFGRILTWIKRLLK